MYSVNIDKLMDIDSEKKESLVQIAHNITEALSSGKSVAVIGGKVGFGCKGSEDKGISVNHSPKFHKAILYWGK